MTVRRLERLLFLFATVGIVGGVAACKTSGGTSGKSGDDQTGAAARSASESPPAASTGYLVVAPDRGFMGNDEIRAFHDEFSESRTSALIFATDRDETREAVSSSLNALQKDGVERAVVLPYFLSTAHPRWEMVSTILEKRADEHDDDPSLIVRKPFGESYYAVEALADRLRQIENPKQKRVVVLGAGAHGPESRKRVRGDFTRLATTASDRMPFASIETMVWPDWYAPKRKRAVGTSRKRLGELCETANNEAVVVPFHLGQYLDGMMNLDNMLIHMAPDACSVRAESAVSDELVRMWMERESLVPAELEDKRIGVVVLAHGAKYRWNERMRRASRPLEEDYLVEYAFTMADRDVVARAVDRLEERGARALVVVRVFGLASSFRARVRRMLGLDVEYPDEGAPEGKSGHTVGMPHMGSSKRIRTPLARTTLGGLEDDALFAKALADRVREISETPSKETVILAAHGVGSDPRNEHWMNILESLSAQMKAQLDGDFRAFEYGTWREDWPEKRKKSVPRMREIVREASKDAGRALLVPARTNGTGPGAELLGELSFEYAEGFAPHPLFADWLQKQVEEGVGTIESNLEVQR